jgi:hypothetical protein
MKNASISLVFAAIICSFSACSNGQDSLSTRIVSPLSGSTVLLEYKGGKVRAEDVENELLPKIESARKELVNAYRQAAENKAIERLCEQEAEKHKIRTCKEYQESLFGKSEITEQQAKEYITANKLQNATLEEVKRFLVAQRAIVNQQRLRSIFEEKAQPKFTLGPR